MFWIYILSIAVAVVLCVAVLLYRKLVHKHHDYLNALHIASSCREEYGMRLDDAYRKVEEQERVIEDLQFEVSELRYKLSRKPNKKQPKR